MRALHYLPVDTAHVDDDLDLAKAITEKNLMALRNPCDLFTMPHVDEAHSKFRSSGSGVNLRDTPGALAQEPGR